MRRNSWTTLAAAAAVAFAGSAFAENAVTVEEASGPVRAQPPAEQQRFNVDRRDQARSDAAYSGSTEQTEENLRRFTYAPPREDTYTPDYRSAERADAQRLLEQRRNNIN